MIAVLSVVAFVLFVAYSLSCPHLPAPPERRPNIPSKENR